MGSLIQDIRYGGRALAKTPGITAVVILSLALGIGANTAIFTLINAVMLRALPVQNPERLVLYGNGSQRGFVSGLSGRWNIFSYPLYEALREDPSFQGVCAFRTTLDRMSVRPQGDGGDGPAQLAWGRLVSGNYFSVLGVQAAVGRALTAEDDRPEAPPVAVMGYDYWRRVFHLDRSVVGQVLDLNGMLFTVVGVTPPEFFGESLESELPDFWVPITLQPRVMPQRGSVLKNAGINWTHLMGRLKPGVSIEQAQAGINVTFQQFLRREAGPKLTPHRESEIQRSHIALTPGGGGVSNLRFRYSRPLHILLAVVALVLVIACANVANVLLSRAAAREREISMRLALGAGRRRLVRQLLTESALLATLGGALGMLFAGWTVSLLVAAVSTGSRTIPLNVSPDVRILGFTLVVSLLTGILFGLAPALRATKVDLVSALKEGSSRGRLRWGLPKALVVSQVALSLPLLAGAGLFLRTLEQLRHQDLGFNGEHVLEVGIDPRIAGYKPDRLDSLYQALLDRVNALPGVRVASLSLYSPMSGDNWSGGISVQGYLPPPTKTASTQWVWVGPRYVETLGMTLLLGRDLGPRDTQTAQKVAVVNEAFVRRYLAGQSPIGRRFAMEVPTKGYDAAIEIVGVVKDFKFNNPRQEYWPVTFLPLSQATFPPARYAANLEVRAIGDPAGVAATVRQALREVDKNLPVTGVKTLSRQIDESLTRERLVASLSSFFGLLALLLACLGLYGVLAHVVVRRSREIGIRMAVGAQQANVLSMMLREALFLVVLGAGIGLPVALGVSHLVSSQLYGLKPFDPPTMVVATLVLTAAAALASYLPARRASRLDPMDTLRAE